MAPTLTNKAGTATMKLGKENKLAGEKEVIWKKKYKSRTSGRPNQQQRPTLCIRAATPSLQKAELRTASPTLI